MRASLAAAAALSLVTFAAQAKRSEERRVGEFDAVEVSAGIHAVVSIGDRSVDVEGDDEAVAKVRTEVHDGVLEIGWVKSHGFFNWNTGEVTVHVRTPHLRMASASGGAHADVTALTEAKARLSASGGGSVTIERAAARELEIEASGGATVTAAGIDADSLSAGGSGGAVLELKGRAAEADLSFSGGTTVKARGLEAQRVRVDGSGGGDARLKISEAVKGSLSGGSTLHVDGSPRAKVRTSGGGEVVYADGRRDEDSDRGRGKRHRSHDDSDDDD